MRGSEALLKINARTLPICVCEAAECLGIKVVDYTAFVNVYEIDKPFIYKNISYGGFSVRLDGGFVCVLNRDLCGKARRKWTAAHELGHILCGHISDGREEITPRDEREADRFAADFLAPLSVLHFCGVSSPAEIERLCGISHQAAEYRYAELTKKRRSQTESFRMAQRGENNVYSDIFLPDDTEKALIRQFEPFISSYIGRRLSALS